MLSSVDDGDGGTALSLLSINNAELSDRGNYTCKPASGGQASISLHVLEGNKIIHWRNKNYFHIKYEWIYVPYAEWTTLDLFVNLIEVMFLGKIIQSSCNLTLCKLWPETNRRRLGINLSYLNESLTVIQQKQSNVLTFFLVVIKLIICRTRQPFKVILFCGI